MSILKNLLNRINNEEVESDNVESNDVAEATFVLTPDGRKWGVDVDRFAKRCLMSDNEKSKDSEITEGYEKNEDGDMVQVSKIIREMNSQGNVQNDTIRYDLIKTLLSVVLEKKFMNFGSLENELDYDFSFNIAFNTLLKEGIIYEIK